MLCSRGLLFSESGRVRAGMGTDAADYDLSGQPGILIGNFTNESMALYHNDGSGLFSDVAPMSGLGQMTNQSLTFGAFFFDYDLDGLLDVFAANGHVSDDISVVQPTVRYAQPRAYIATFHGRQASLKMSPRNSGGRFRSQWSREARLTSTTTTTAIWIW